MSTGRHPGAALRAIPAEAGMTASFILPAIFTGLQAQNAQNKSPVNTGLQNDSAGSNPVRCAAKRRALPFPHTPDPVCGPAVPARSGRSAP